MAHISSIGSAMFTQLSVAPLTVALPVTQTTVTGVVHPANTFTEIRNVKEFPAIGKPANIVKVPEYGSDTSLQIQGQADSPTMEITLNYVPAEWPGGVMTLNGGGTAKVGSGDKFLFRFALLSKAPTGDSTGALTVDNSCYFFQGKLEAIEVTPSLTDAMTAKLTISVQSEITGAFSY
jgi:hypothetical protein